jgi:hypothetical protein
MSPTGKDVPMILPDLSSNYWKEYKKVCKKTIEYDPQSCEQEIGKVLETRTQAMTSETTVLGLRMFKISNDQNYIFNILEKSLHAINLKVAPFEEKIKAHMVYDYCDHVRKNIDRYSDEEKHQVSQFMQSNFPPKLVDIKKGFPSTASHVFVLNREGKCFLST